MKDCPYCEYKGYSKEACRVHLQQHQQHGEKIDALAHRGRHVGMKVLVGLGAGMLAAVAGLAAAPALGVGMVGNVLLVKAVASLGGAGLGLTRGLQESKTEKIA